MSNKEKYMVDRRLLSNLRRTYNSLINTIHTFDIHKNSSDNVGLRDYLKTLDEDELNVAVPLIKNNTHVLLKEIENRYGSVKKYDEYMDSCIEILRDEAIGFLHKMINDFKIVEFRNPHGLIFNFSVTINALPVLKHFTNTAGMIPYIPSPGTLEHRRMFLIDIILTSDAFDGEVNAEILESRLKRRFRYVRFKSMFQSRFGRLSHIYVLCVLPGEIKKTGFTLIDW